MATGRGVAGASGRALLLWLLLPLAACHLNVLISQAEVMKLLGLDAELYYVRDGIVNSYAMNFIVPVPAHVTDLQFMWQSLGRNALPYVMSIQYESRGAMLPPQVNISETGLVPTTLQTFRVRLPCTGRRSAEIEVRIQLNVSDVERQRNVSLNFKRNKICLKGLSTVPARNESMQASGEGEGAAHPRGATAVLYVAGGHAVVALLPLIIGNPVHKIPRLAGLSTVPARNESMQASGVGEGAAHPRDAAAVLYVAGGCAAAALALLAAATAASSLYRRGNKARHHDSIHTSYTTAAYGSHQNVLLRLDTLGRPPSASGSYATIASLHKFPFGSRRSPSPYATTHIGGEHVYAKPESRVSYYAASNLTHVSQQTTMVRECPQSDPADHLRHLSTARSNIKLEMLVHEGAFGRVYRGVLRRGDTYEEVMVKTVSENASAMQAALLVAEGLRLSGLSHSAVLTPAAACADEPRRPLLIYLCATHSSNLKRWLTACRLGVQAAPLTRELVELGAQAACGLAYLHARRVLHADLAARNCVVDEKLRLKIADNALARDLFPEEYHCLGDNENRPVKWMAPEALLHDQFSTASDTWSLGVLLWELCTLGAQPLAELDASDVAAFVRDGYRPAQPLHCPDELYGLMSWCWSSAPPARPSAPQLLAALHDFRQALATYI